MTTCHTCKWYGHSKVNDKGEACYRPRRMASGLVIKTQALVGFAIPFERSAAVLNEGRADGDVCGPDGTNWEART